MDISLIVSPGHQQPRGSALPAELQTLQQHSRRLLPLLVADLLLLVADLLLLQIRQLVSLLPL
jgi:hypothetical protein